MGTEAPVLRVLLELTLHTFFFTRLFVSILYNLFHDKWVNVSKCFPEFFEPLEQ